MAKRADLTTTALGRAAEDAVVVHLKALGFQILHRNLRAGPLEVDIVAQDGELCVFVEVRLRTARSYLTALASIDAKKKATILRAAHALWPRIRREQTMLDRLRLDVASVTRLGNHHEVEYFAGAITDDPST